MDERFWKTALESVVAAAAVLAGAAALIAWRLRRRQHRRLVANVIWLASDIVSIAESIEEDLDGGSYRGALGGVRSRCQEYRARAEAFVLHEDRVRRLPPPRVTAILHTLHDEHRRMVDLRSEVDSALAARRRSPWSDSARAYTVARALQKRRSGRSSGGLCTRPSTLV